MIRKLLITQFVTLLFLLVCKVTFAQWSNVNPTNASPRYREGTFVIGDTAYIDRGQPGYTSEVDGYTQNGNTWVTERAYPGGGGDQGFRFTINDTAYIGDGATPGYLNNLYMYTQAGGWVQKAVPLGGGRVFSAGFSIGHKGYFGMGFNSINTPLADFYEYDPSTDSWSAKQSLPKGRAGGVAFSSNGKGYMGLGYINNIAGTSIVFKDIYQYDPTANTWTAMDSMPTTFGEGEPAYFVICGKLIVVSGQRVHAGTGVDSATNQTWMFDPSNGVKGKWTRLADFPGIAAYSPQGFTMGDTGFVYGGYTSNSGNLNQMWRFVPFLKVVPAILADTVVCAGTQVTLNASGGTGYSWNTSDTGSTVIVTPLTTTTYFDTISGNPCYNLDSIVIKVNPAPALIVEPQSPKICNGQGVNLNVAGSGTNFIWSPSTGLNTTTGDTVLANPSITITYTVIGNDSLGCQATGTDTVSVGSSVPLDIEPQSPVLCFGSEVILYIAGGGTNFTWSPSTGLSATTGDSVIANPTADITYTVTGMDSIGCSSTGTDEVSVVPAPNKPTITVSITGDSLISSATQGNQWYFNDTIINGATNQVLVITGQKTGSYTVEVINPANGCSATSDSLIASDINQLIINEQVSLFPNPTTGNIFITISSSVQDLSEWNMEVTDVLGRVLFTKQSLSHNNEIDLYEFSDGVYFIAVANKMERAVYTVVKQ